MKRIIALLLITASIAACGNSSSESTDTSNTDPQTVTSGNTAAREGQEIPRDSIGLSSDSTGNINPADTTKK